MTGQARQLQEKVKQPVVVFDRSLNVRSHVIWEHNPRITWRWDRVSPVHHLHNGPSVRPYIASKTEQKWIWKDFACPVGEIYLTDAEKQFAAHCREDMILLEPNCKAKASPNKDWGRVRWQRLADLARKAGLFPVQIGEAGGHVLQGVTLLPTPAFRLACAVLARCRAAVLPEGGLHHAAAALGVPAVVVYGGYISPRQTGYNLHRNLFTGGAPCGMRYNCAHCAKAMSEISPEFVLSQLLEIIRDKDIPRV